MSHGPEPGLLPFKVETSDEYAIYVARTFGDVMSRDGSVTLVGSCPRCKHVMEYLIASGGVTRSWVRRASGLLSRAENPAPASPVPAAGDDVEKMICTCEHEHPGRPADYLGCGAWWNLAVTTT
jgi:hypothetical protein